MSETQTLVNGEQRQEPKDEASDTVTVEEQITSVTLQDKAAERSVPADKETQVKVQSIFQQVRKQIRTQMGMTDPKSSIRELVQKVKDREKEMASVNGEPDGKNRSDEERKGVETSSDERRAETDAKDEELSAVFAKELEASKQVLREEFKEQMCQLRKEMQAYTDQALKDVECKMQRWPSHHLQQANQQADRKGPDKKAKSSAAPSLASRKGRVLTRTMTTIIPKTCAPVIMGPRAKSETCTKDNGSQLLLRDPDFLVFSSPGSRHYQSRRPLPPPGPPLQHRPKLGRTKAQTGK